MLLPDKEPPKQTSDGATAADAAYPSAFTSYGQPLWQTSCQCPKACSNQPLQNEPYPGHLSVETSAYLAMRTMGVAYTGRRSILKVSAEIRGSLEFLDVESALLFDDIADPELKSKHAVWRRAASSEKLAAPVPTSLPSTWRTPGWSPMRTWPSRWGEKLLV